MASRALQGARPVQAIREARAVPAGAGHTDRDWREPRRRRDRRLSRRTAGGDLPHPGVRVLRRSHVAPGDHDLSSRAEGAGWTGHDRRHGDCMSLGVRPSCSDARSVAVRSTSSRSPRSGRTGTTLMIASEHARPQPVRISRGGWLDILRFVAGALIILYHFREAAPTPLGQCSASAPLAQIWGCG